MHLAVGNPPVLDPRSPFLTLGTPPFVHVGSICSIHIATDGTFGLVRILPMIGPRREMGDGKEMKEMGDGHENITFLIHFLRKL